MKMASMEIEFKLARTCEHCVYYDLVSAQQRCRLHDQVFNMLPSEVYCDEHEFSGVVKDVAQSTNPPGDGGE
jgi:hypothetical protein